MKLTLQRCKFTDLTTQGWLLIDGKYECYTLEDKWRDLTKEAKVPGKTCIPEGTYKVILDYSNLWKARIPFILDVPYFTNIRIHSGNTELDTKGCILVGLSRSENWVGQSRIAFNRLMAKMEDATKKKEDITIEIQRLQLDMDEILNEREIWQEI